MRVYDAKGSLHKWCRAWPASDYFREQSLIVLLGLTVVPAWLWVGYTVQSRQLGPAGGIVLVGLILGASWSICAWHRTRYLRAVCAFLVAQVLFVTSMLCVHRNLTAGYCFLLPIVGGMLIGRAGPYIVAAVALLIEVLFLRVVVGPVSVAGALAAQMLVDLLVAEVAAQAALGLYEALDSAEASARRASDHAEEARRHRGELQRALGSLDLAWAQLQRANSELFQAREAADAALRFKTEFAAQLSHELRTSLNLVLGFSETMAFSQHVYGAKLPAPYLRDVTEIHRNSRHLLALIDDVLDLSKLDAGRMGLHREPVDLDPILREATDIARPLVERKGLKLELEVPSTLPTLLLDRARIRQVVLNLLSNAVRAVSQGRIEVRATCTGDQVIVQVSDTGAGIPLESLERVFEEFHQLGDSGGPSGAAGLGLAVSKRIIGLHGGRMWAESEVGMGSTFSFALPLPHGAAYAPATRTAAAPPSLSRPAVVAIGDAEDDEAKLLQRHLGSYTVLTAATCADAARLARDVGARAVIVNSAFEEAPDVSRIPVPLIACPLPGPRRAQEALGVASFVRKPVTVEAIQRTLRGAATDAASVLIVDDEPAAVRLMERMVQGGDKPYQVFRAYSDREALARTRAQRPDAILLDLAMADGDGLWLISALRADPDTRSIPIVVVTARDVEEAGHAASIGIRSAVGFSPTETLHYLEALLSAVPPSSTMRHGLEVASECSGVLPQQAQLASP